MNNKELSHIWANQSRPSASASNFYFEGPILYSYGHHFKVGQIADIEGQRVALLNPGRYSVTTSRHCQLAASASCHLRQVFLDPVLWCDATASLAALEEAVRMQEQREADQRDLDRRAKREIAASKRRAKKDRAEIEAAFTGELEAWRDGGLLPRLLRTDNILSRRAFLRVITMDGKEWIETSRGAKVPASVARKVWPILRDKVAAEEANPAPAWVPFFTAPEFNWGDYRGISLCRVAAGSPVEMQVGCHSIPFAEVRNVAEQMGLRMDDPLKGLRKEEWFLCKAEPVIYPQDLQDNPDKYGGAGLHMLNAIRCHVITIPLTSCPKGGEYGSRVSIQVTERDVAERILKDEGVDVWAAGYWVNFHSVKATFKGTREEIPVWGKTVGDSVAAALSK